jgi:hypothetical protein
MLREIGGMPPINGLVKLVAFVPLRLPQVMSASQPTTSLAN